ncbi:hypothetical protein GLOIN_2v244654 [Rhizophagus irregularis DAOM 181602=DAOM 197198]|nr:hypothetical protein GLOIN_2v244654 [Rhizophagus irregularis DAOM 181602=DAOM 197198]CAB5353554.1 unnamed protein product [Rhizophagus irregularis]
MEMFNNRKRNPLSAIDASYEDHVEAIDTIRKKIEANTISEGTNTLSRLDGFEKQLEEREALLKQKENNIKNTIEAQVDMKQTTYSFKHQLEDQHNSRSADLERQYKSRISTLEKALLEING